MSTVQTDEAELSEYGLGLVRGAVAEAGFPHAKMWLSDERQIRFARSGFGAVPAAVVWRAAALIAPDLLTACWACCSAHDFKMGTDFGCDHDPLDEPWAPVTR